MTSPVGTDLGPRRSRSRSADTAALLAAWIAPIAATVVATPFVLDRIGAAEFGLFAVVIGLVVTVASLGMSRPLAVSTAGQGAAARRAMTWGLVLAVLGALAIAVLATVVPLDWLVGSDVEPAQARRAVLAGAFAVLGTALMTTVSGRVIGVSRFVAVGVITATIGVATSVGYLAIAALGGSAIPLVLWNGAVTCAGALVFLRAGRTRRDVDTDDRAARVRSVDPPSMWPFVVVQVAGNLAIVVERVGLGATTGLDAVTEFVVPHTMVLTLHAGLLWMTAPLLTRAVHLVRAGDDDGLNAMYGAASRLGATVAAFGGVTLAVVGHGLLERWLGGSSVMPTVPFLILTVYATALPLTVVPWNIADATGHARVNAEVGGVWLALVVAGAVATSAWGIDATVTARAALVITLPFYVRRVEQRALGGQHAWGPRWVVRLLLAAGATAAIEWIAWSALGRTVPAALAAVAAGSVVFLLSNPTPVRRIAADAFGGGTP